MTIAVLVLLVGLAGILIGSMVQQTSKGDSSEDGTLYRIHDEEAGVVCYVADVSASGVSVDCLPENETRLNEQGDSMTDKNHNKATEEMP